jgi:hypothetical protein
MNLASAIPVVLLLLFGSALSIGAAAVAFVLLLRRHQQPRPPDSPGLEPKAFSGYAALRPAFVGRPACWLAVKNTSLPAVQRALGLHHPKPCSFMEGMYGDEKLFISPPVQGWILVLGASLPEPGDDIDACFRLLLDLSRKLGEVQFFIADPVLHEHGWVRVSCGRVARAYAWAGKTLWTQGRMTEAEKNLRLKCFDYSEPSGRLSLSETEVIATNVEKVPLLAARWSLDPACIDERLLERERGVAGELSAKY